MKNEDALKLLREMKHRCNMPTSKDPRRFLKSEALEIAAEAVRKQIPAKPWLQAEDDECLYYHYECPECGRWLSPKLKQHHCRCGQTIDWSNHVEVFT